MYNSPVLVKERSGLSSREYLDYYFNEVIKVINVKEFTEQELTICYKCINKLDVSEAVVKKIKEQLQREMMKLKQIDFFEE